MSEPKHPAVNGIVEITTNGCYHFKCPLCRYSESDTVGNYKSIRRFANQAVWAHNHVFVHEPDDTGLERGRPACERIRRVVWREGSFVVSGRIR